MKAIYSAEKRLTQMKKALVGFLMFLDDDNNLEEVVSLGNIEWLRQIDGYEHIPYLPYSGKQSLRG